MKLPVLVAIGSLALLVQTAPPTGSVSGRVLDADSGTGIPDYPVENNVRTDARGNFKLTGLKPGPFQIRLFGDRIWPELNITMVNVIAGQEVSGVDVRIRLDGEISGRVLDQNKDPVYGVPVRAIGREYYAGGLYYFTDTGSATTNDRGEYVMRGVRAGRSLVLLVEKRRALEKAISDAPADLALRRPAYRATYYPNADSIQAATVVTLRSGEHRAAMDIQILRSPGFCVDGTLMADGAPASLNFKVADELSSSANMIPGSGSSGPINVSSGPDGKIRLCDLYPGQFRIAALRRPGAQPDLFGVASITISKEDVHNVRVMAEAPAAIPAEVVWEGTPPDAAAQAQFVLIAQAVTNDSILPPGQRPRYPVPGTFSFTALRGVEYLLQTSLTPQAAFPNAYIKDITYGISNVLNSRFRAAEGTLRVTIANDGGFIKATAPPGAQILILPDSAANEAILASAMVSGQADTNGSYTSRILAPGKYHVLAIEGLIDRTPECVGRLWKARTRAQEVEVAPKATASVTLADALKLAAEDGR